MVLGITCLASDNYNFAKIVALNELLHGVVMRHVALIRYSSIQALQCIVLLIQHALLLPYSVNLYLTGEAMKMAATLGLYWEPHSAIVKDPAEVELRRRPFWVVRLCSLRRTGHPPTSSLGV